MSELRLLERRTSSQGAALGPSRRRWPKRMTASVLTAAVVGAALAVTGNLDRGDGGSEGRSGSSTGTANVTRRTLREQERVDGSLGYGKSRPVVNGMHGRITGIAAEGTVVQRGDVLYRVNEQPVVLLFGEVPAYRRMATGIEDGADVAQLEANLKELGFADDLISSPDSRFDSSTAAAVKRWQKHVGTTQDGVVELGDVVFLPGAQRVGSHRMAVGADAQQGQEVFAATGTTRVVTVELDARKQAYVKAGDKVEIELPGGKVTAGTVADVGKVAKSAGSSASGSGTGTGGSSGSGSGASSSDGKPTVTVTTTIDDQAAVGDLDSAPVKVRITRSSRDSVLAVPVNALLALPDGGYGVEVDQAGARRVVKVETGVFSGGLVEVSGDGISEGVTVVVPT